VIAALGQGLGVTLVLLAVSSVAGIALAVPLALARLSRMRLLSVPAAAYAVAFRGTPLLVQIYLVYYGLAQFAWVQDSVLWPVLRTPMGCALLALSLNMAAYAGEVVRGGILAVPAGEREAAVAFGLGYWTRTRRIVLPRAIRLILPALGNEVLVQLKSTALASTITLVDLTGAARRLAAAQYDVTPLLAAGAVYLVLSAAIAAGLRRLERH
jgi:putative lysine/arginine/ornithine/histidine/octopine transport system permease protein